MGWSEQICRHRELPPFLWYERISCAHLAQVCLQIAASAAIRCSTVETEPPLLVKRVASSVLSTFKAWPGMITAGVKSVRRNTTPVSMGAGLRVRNTFLPVCKPMPVALMVFFRVLCRITTRSWCVSYRSTATIYIAVNLNNAWLTYWPLTLSDCGGIGPDSSALSSCFDQHYSSDPKILSALSQICPLKIGITSTTADHRWLHDADYRALASRKLLSKYHPSIPSCVTAQVWRWWHPILSNNCCHWHPIQESRGRPRGGRPSLTQISLNPAKDGAFRA